MPKASGQNLFMLPNQSGVSSAIVPPMRLGTRMAAGPHCLPARRPVPKGRRSPRRPDRRRQLPEAAGSLAVGRISCRPVGQLPRPTHTRRQLLGGRRELGRGAVLVAARRPAPEGRQGGLQGAWPWPHQLPARRPTTEATRKLERNIGRQRQRANQARR